jgi:hypothetical protein
MRSFLLVVLLLSATVGRAQQPPLENAEVGRTDAAVSKVTRSDAPEGPMIPRSYPVLASVGERVAGVSSEFSNGDSGEIDWKKFFLGHGVKWPEGSSIRYLPSIGRFVVENTRENLELFESVLQDLNVLPSQIDIQVEYVAFDMTNIAVIAARGITVSALTELWTKGYGQLIAAPRVVTQSGVEATVKGVTECIYPTEFGGSDTNAASETSTNVVSAVIPGSFETRETGIILQVLPEVSAEGYMISLTMAPEFVEEPTEWRDFGFKYVDSNGREQQPRMEQPFFHVYSASTSLIVENGKRILMSGGMPSRDGKRLVYAFVTARLIGIDGEPLKRKGREIPSDTSGL